MTLLFPKPYLIIPLLLFLSSLFYFSPYVRPAPSLLSDLPQVSPDTPTSLSDLTYPAYVHTSFLFTEDRYPPPPQPFQEHPDHEPHFDFAVTPPKEPGMVVPNVVHFIWPSRAPASDEEANMGLKGEEEFLPYSVYLSIRSALLVLKPEKTYL